MSRGAVAVRPPDDPSLRFWLAFAEAEGALWEDAEDKVILVLPESLQRALELPEEVAVTSDPDVAREDGALLLMPGHHVLDGAASRVLHRGDVGETRLPWPATALPAAGDILESARDEVGAHHGRIDPSGEPPAPAWLPVLRVGALVRYRVSLQERFQEREEAWVDGRTGLAIPPSTVARLRGSGGGSEGPGLPGLSGRLLRADLSLGVAGAHRLLESRAGARRDELARQASGALREETARANAYYEGVLASIARRRAIAVPERRAVLDEQARVAGAERARRLQEIEESFRPTHEIHPFRLHLVLVPALTLPVLVRRGRRVYPFALTWILPSSGFAPVACPHCGAGEGLVAGRDRLGCGACLPRRAETLSTPSTLPSPSSPAIGPAQAIRRPSPNGSGSEEGLPPAVPRASRKAKARPPRASGGSRPRPHDRFLTSPAAEKAGRRLAGKFWEAMALGKRWPQKAVAAGSPFAVLADLYGADAPAVALGMPPGAVPVEASMFTLGRDPLQPRLTRGHVLVDEDWYPYGLLWRSTAGTPLVQEILPTTDAMGRPPRRHDLHPDLVERLFDGVPEPEPAAALDPVSRDLWDTELPLRGVSFVARCLATWRRAEAPGAQTRHPVEAVAAAVAILTGRASGLRPNLPDVAAAHAADAHAVKEALSELRGQLGDAAGRR